MNMLDKGEITSRFKERNKARFFQALFPFSKKENAAIAKEVIRLCALLSDKHRDSFEEYYLLIEEAQKHQEISSIDTISLLEIITKKKQLGTHFIPAFICSTLLRTSYNKDKFDQYKALALLTIARLSYIGEHDSKIKTLSDEIRLFSSGKREDLSGYLPEIIGVNFKELLNGFEVLVDKTSQSAPPKTVLNQLEYYHRPFKAADKLSEGYQRNVNTQRFRKNGALTVKPRSYLNDEGDAAVEISQLHFEHKHVESWQGEDFADNDPRSLNVITSSENCSKSEALGAIQAKAIFENLKKKAMHLPCDIYSMTHHELYTLVKSCEDSLFARQDEDIAQLLLLMLITGNTKEQLKHTKNKRCSNQQRQIKWVVRTHRLPSQTIREELRFLTQNISTTILLPLPDFITARLNSFKFSKLQASDFKAYLQSINKRKGLHLTLTKVSNYLSDYCAHRNIDPVIPHIISGVDNKVLPAVFYTQIPSSILLSHFQNYLSHLSAHSKEGLWDTDDESQLGDDEYIGSPLHIDSKKLRYLFSRLKEQIHENKRRTDVYFSDNGHNDITLMTQFVLMLASGYRTVTGWFGKREDFHLPTGTYWINDKNTSMGDSSRCILLADIAILYLKRYIDYLHQAVIYHGNRAPSLKQRYEKSLTSEEHFFFYRQDSSFDDVTPSNFTQFADKLFPLQPNWARHHIRSLLCHHGVAPELISAWMGHQDMGKQAFHSFSQLSQSQLKQVSHIINQLFIELGLGSDI
ncbi:integrase [Photobacterium leiognathi]|uniref:integrase n=3 Tax=Photobacterium leiognathi TaxID=553611 RepID=UPI002734895C|nr:integrase [Photobacterium leiognathi]